MDKLEQYLDRVCLSIGGPKSLRRHVRQELREHLRDAVAELKATGLSEAEALTRALEHFGKPEDVRSELEATHGHRLMPVVIDKAMQWKEMTMKAKWLWTTWTYLAVVGILVMQIFYFCFTMVYFTPKLQKILDDDSLQDAIDSSGVQWLNSSFWSFLGVMDWVGENLWWLAMVVLTSWGLFEWRVRSENKTFMRLSVLGTGTLAMTAAVVFMTGIMIILLILGAVDATYHGGNQVALALNADINTAIGAIEQAKKGDWEAIQGHVIRAFHSTETLSRLEPTIPMWRLSKEQRAQLQLAQQNLLEAQQAVRDKNADKFESAMKKFRESYAPIRAWAARIAAR